MDKHREELIRTRPWDSTGKSENPPTPADAELKQFQENSAEFNARVHQVLADIPVPPTLRDQILARRKIIPLPRWNRRRLWAIAAALTLLASILVITLRTTREDQTFAGFRSRMVGFALRQYSMDILTNELPSVRQYLARSGAPADFAIPAPLLQTPVMGGAKLAWQGTPVAMVCFTGSGGKTLYMFVIDSAETGPPPTSAQLAEYKGIATASWTSGGRTFLLAGKVPISELQSLTRS